MSDKEFVFKFGAYSPATIPMDRLAEYLAQLALLLGEKQSVHFERLEEGSTVTVCRVQSEAVPKVEARLSRTKVGDGPDDARRAVRVIDAMLREDNTGGELLELSGAEIIMFPGNRRIAEPTFGPFNQPGTIDGQVIRLGGRTKEVPVTLMGRDGIEVHCHTTRETARDLARHIFGGEVRCSGTARWFRQDDGKWQLRHFTISSFDVLDGRPLGEVVEEIRKIEGNRWRDVADPWIELERLRKDDEEAE